MSKRYRDRKTGRFVSQKTWQRSKSKRYVRESVPRRLAVTRETETRAKRGVEAARHRLPEPIKRRALPEPEERDEFEEDADAEYGGAFDSPGKKK